VTASRDDNGQLTSLGSLIIPNPNLKPEFTYNLDAGINKTFNKKASLSFNGFYTLYRDAITTDFTTLNGESIVLFGGDSSYVITSVNKSKAFIYGGFGQIIYQITKFLELNSSITYTKGRIDENNERTPLDHIPPTFGRTGLSCQFNKMKIEFWSMYNATKPISEYRLNTEDNEANALPEGMPGWYTLNIRGAYQINKHLRAQLAIENILDANYRLFASNISAPGRNISVTLRATL
jgi:hemoglobin/transferrin/lactoferrin receptor protein